MKIAIATGDPAGVGPEIAVRAAREVLPEGIESILFGDARQLEALVQGEFRIVDTGPVSRDAVARHAVDAECGASQLRSLEAACDAVRGGHAAALATAPTSKAAIALSGTPFVGQTEFLAGRAGLADDEVTMLFLGSRLRLGLVTTHLAVRDVPDALTVPRVVRAVRHLGQALERLGRPHGARLAVAALNPHAGEGGMFGYEEARVLTPAIVHVAALEPFRSGRIHLEGIVPAETALRRAAEGTFDGVVAMMHDQATIASKLLDWGVAVNTTWGLPFIRTSVDHGVAYDAAAAGRADASGMVAAVRMAAVLARGR